MASAEERVPGITFHFLSEVTTGLNLADRRRRVCLTLEAAIGDDELWEEVKKKFQNEGVRIYKGEDFHTAVLDAVKEDYESLQRHCVQLERELRQEKDARILAERELANYKEPLARLGNALGR